METIPYFTPSPGPASLAPTKHSRFAFVSLSLDALIILLRVAVEIEWATVVRAEKILVIR